MLEKILQSSQDPKQFSMTIVGVLLSFVPAVIYLSRAFGLEGVDETFLTTLIDLIGQFVQQGVALISLIMIAWGLLRKVIPKPDFWDKKD